MCPQDLLVSKPPSSEVKDVGCCILLLCGAEYLNVAPRACITHSLPTEPSLLKIILPWQAETSCGSGQLGVMGIWIPILPAWISALTLSNTFAVLMDLLYLGLLQAPSCPHKKKICLYINSGNPQPTVYRQLGIQVYNDNLASSVLATFLHSPTCEWIDG